MPPVGLVVALYEGAIDASCGSQDMHSSTAIFRPHKALNKVINILDELMRP